jgi:hypothetical protein
MQAGLHKRIREQCEQKQYDGNYPFHDHTKLIVFVLNYQVSVNKSIVLSIVIVFLHMMGNPSITLKLLIII